MLSFEIVIKEGIHELGRIPSRISIHEADLSVADYERVPEIEAFLERLFGLRFHINTIHVSEAPRAKGK